MNSKVAVTWLATVVSISASFGASAANLTNFPPTIIASGAWGSIAPIGLSSFDVSDGSEALYRSWFDSNSFEGDLLEHSLSSAGAVTPTASWSAKAMLDVVTYPNRKVVLGNADYQCDSSGDNLVKYICGDQANEASIGGTAAYRDRISKLGAIIHSNPVYVGAPKFSYTFNSYLSFRSSKQSRAGRVYVGANDGMLHGFDTSGNELFGYIPGLLSSNLSNWATGSGSQYLVDGPLASADVYADFSGTDQWKTIVVGGLGAGGKGYYGWDATTPIESSDTVSTIAGKRLWEFNPTNMGYSYGKALIARTNATGNKWALIAPNGYAEGGKARLFIREINDPTNNTLKDFVGGTTHTAPNGNGLSSPTAIDINNDYKVDYIYAGDLDGNLWRFKVTDSTPANWTKRKIFIAKDSGGNKQPIIAAPELALLSAGKVMVYFGTGDPWGVSSAADHSFYAIKDDLTSTTIYQRSSMQLRVMADTSDSDYRTVDSTNASNYDQGNGAKVTYNWPTERGWFTDLSSSEHLLQAPILQDSRIQNMAHNLSSGDNWLTQLEYEQGLLPNEPIFDTNNDGTLTSADDISSVRVTSAKRTADLTSGLVLAKAGNKALAYYNQWNEGTASTLVTTTTTTTETTTTTKTLEPKQCTNFAFDRFDFTSEPSSYSIKFIAHLSDDPADDIWVMRSGMDADARTKASTQTPAAGSADRGAGAGTTTNGAESWTGLTMYLGNTGSDRISMNTEYEGPYAVKGFTVQFGNITLERIHDGVSTCDCSGGFKICGESERIRYDRNSEGTSEVKINNQNWSLVRDLTTGMTGGGSEVDDMTETTETETTNTTTTGVAGSAADGAVGADGQPLADDLTGRLRWRELLF